MINAFHHRQLPPGLRALSGAGSVLLMTGLIGAKVFAAGYTISGATVTLMSGTIVQTMSDVTIANGSLSAGGAELQVGGNWTTSGGSFIAGTSTVTFQGTGTSTSTLTGSTTFYSLRCVVPGKSLILPIASTQTVIGPILIAGNSNAPIRLHSSSAGTYAYLVNQGTNTVTNVDVQDNNAQGGLTMIARGSSINNGHTVNWAFSPPSGGMVIGIFSSSVTVGWSTIGGSLGYSLETSSSPDFTGTLISSVTMNPSLGVLTVSGLSSDATYYLQVGALYTGATAYAGVSPSPIVTLTTLLAARQIFQVFTTSVTTNWAALSASQGYDLAASTAPDFSGAVFSSTTASVSLSTLTVSGLAAHTTYYVEVGGINASGAINFSLVGSTLTSPGGPPLTVTVPTVFASSMNVVWSTALNSTGYEVDASTSAAFSGSVLSSVTPDPAVLGLNVSGLLSDTTYFVRAGALYNGATTYATAIATSTLTAPITGAQFATVFLTSSTINWVPLTNAQGYLVQASSTSDFSGTLIASATTNIALSTLTIAGLTASQLYYVRVGGLNWDNAPNFSLVGAATAGAGPSPSGATIIAVGSSSATVQWTGVASAIGYTVDASTAANFSGTLLSSGTSVLSDLSLSPQGLNADTTYYLRVGAVFAGGTSDIGTTPASTSTLTAPITDGQTVAMTSSTITVAWSALPAAQGYVLQASADGDFSGSVTSSKTSNGAAISLVLSGLSAGTTYDLQVGGVNWNGAANFSPVTPAATLPGPAPTNPLIAQVLATSIMVTWGSVNAQGGYRLDVSTTSDFSSTINSASTTNGSATTLTVTGLTPGTTYYARVGADWNGAFNFASTTPPSAETVVGGVSGTPQAPWEIDGALLDGGNNFQVTWSSVTLNTDDQPTTIDHYILERSTALLGSYSVVATLPATTFTDQINGGIFFYHVIAVDTSGNSSAPSDAVDSSPQANLWVQPPDGSDTTVEIPGPTNTTLMGQNNDSGDIVVRVTRRTEDEGGSVLRSYFIGAYSAATGLLITNYSFGPDPMIVSLDYAQAITPTTGTVAPYWVDGSNVIALSNPVKASGAPLAVTVHNSGIYQVRVAETSSRFSLQPGSPYPKILTPNRLNENRRLFFLFNNPNNEAIAVSIYDIKDRKVRDISPDASAPIPGAAVWDVKDSNGCVVPTGVYLYKARSGKDVVTGTVVVAR